MSDKTTQSETATERKIPGGVVIRRSRRRGARRDADGTSASYRPTPGPEGVLVATAVALTPTALGAFETEAFSSAAYFPVDLEAGTALEALTAPQPPETPVDAPQVAAPVEAIEPEQPAAVVETVESEVAPVEASAPVVEETVTPEAAPEAPVASVASVASVAIVPEAPVAVVPEAPVEAKPAEVEDTYSGKVSADAAERITQELLTAAEDAEKKEAARLERGDEPAPKGAVDAATPTTTRRAAGTRVLGRIDLNKKQVPAKAAQPAKTADKAKPATTTDDPASARKKKRKVVRKEDMFDALERSFTARPRKKRAAPGQKVRKTELTTPKASKRIVRINEVTTPAELARSMGVKVPEVLGSMMKMGVMKTINDIIDFDTSALVADEFGYRVENTAIDLDQLLEIGGENEAETESLARPAVVTVMGHVDHGKTSLLDVIRRTNVTASESGGITQHIGAYLVDTPRGRICFLDTPGHAAFTAMRARGASVTDVVILVAAADDGVMPQTIEAVNHAKAANIPVVVAVNKMDRPDASMDRIKQQLSDHGLVPEDWGGDTQFLPVSALKGDGIDELLEAVLLQAEILDLKASPDARVVAAVVEARLDRGRGPVATVLVQQGTLKRGDHFVVGEITGRVRAMTDHAGKEIKEALPSTPVEIIGLDGVPSAGDSLVVVDDPSRGEQAAKHRRETARKQALAAASSTRMSLEDLQRQVASGEASELRVVIKADVDGSVEALKHALEQLSTEEVALCVIHGGVGAVNESDVQLAMASGGIIVGFHVRPEAKARGLAEREGIDIRLHEVIYEIVDEVKAGLEGLLAPDHKEVFLGRAEVRDTFSTPRGTIAGSYVLDGNIGRGNLCRLLRDNVVIHTGKVGSLRRFKDDVREVAQSYECGIGIENYNDLKAGDVIECHRIDEVKRTLEQSRQKDENAAKSEKAKAKP
ncbi:MAG: translation initiation factor IF-2 [Hyphomicrobiaceae bacterium]|jgi:translation initiation factor IF-2